jgi:hypothetical protein
LERYSPLIEQGLVTALVEDDHDAAKRGGGRVGPGDDLGEPGDLAAGEVAAPLGEWIPGMGV